MMVACIYIAVITTVRVKVVERQNAQLKALIVSWAEAAGIDPDDCACEEEEEPERRYY
jgi:hypothetical protein